MKDSEILKTYMGYERDMRARIPGNYLLPEDVEACITTTAAVLNLDREHVADTLRRHWTMQGG